MTFTTRPTLQGTFGMASSTHWIASQSAMRMLELGGNAFDAAVTAGFVLHVVEPHLNGPGGEVPAIIATAQDPAPRVLAGQGPAPSGATIEHFTSLGIDLVPGSGPLAAASPALSTPGCSCCATTAPVPLADVLEPAIGYAAGGHPLLERVERHGGGRAGAVRERLGDVRRGLAAGRQGAEPGTLFPTRPTPARCSGWSTRARPPGRDRAAQIDAARRAWSAGLRRRGGRHVLPAAVPRLQRRGPRRPGHR